MLSDSPGEKRSRRLYVLWTIALALLLTAGAVCWLVVVPVWRVSGAIERSTECACTLSSIPGEIQALGGQERAAWTLHVYLMVPGQSVHQRRGAVLMLEECGPTAIPYLASLAHDEDAQLRQAAAEALKKIRGKPGSE